jgi:hypothetical protein
LIQAARAEIKRQYQRSASVAPDTLREALQDFFYRETQSRPVVLPSFVRVQESAPLAPKLRQVRSMRV